MHRLILVATCALALPLLGCADGSREVDVTISPPEPVTLSAASRLSVSVYGHDAFLADAAATRIIQLVEPVTELPLKVALVLPPDPHLLIDQGHGPVARDDARFYLAGIHVDVDGDGQICPSDLAQDFDDGGPIDFDLDGPIGPFSVAMRESTAPCQPFPPP